MPYPLYVVDAFTSVPFHGNPAAVVLLEQPCQRGSEYLLVNPRQRGSESLLEAPMDEPTMQAIAREMNLSETAFVVPRASSDADFDLRWFTPTVEVSLCGHATLAAAFVVGSRGRSADMLRFHTKSGVLSARRSGGAWLLDFPSDPPVAVDDRKLHQAIEAALGTCIESLHKARDLVAVVDSSERVRALRPDFVRIATLDAFALAVTARTDEAGPDADVDFVSRFFAPRQGIPEDPVTGSLHTTLAPLWGGRLGKRRMRARQVGPRGGELFCALHERDRVQLQGEAVLVSRGELLVGRSTRPPPSRRPLAPALR